MTSDIVWLGTRKVISEECERRWTAMDGGSQVEAGSSPSARERSRGTGTSGGERLFCLCFRLTLPCCCLRNVGFCFSAAGPLSVFHLLESIKICLYLY